MEPGQADMKKKLCRGEFCPEKKFLTIIFFKAHGRLRWLCNSVKRLKTSELYTFSGYNVERGNYVSIKPLPKRKKESFYRKLFLLLFYYMPISPSHLVDFS